MDIERVTLDSDTPGQELFLHVFRFRGAENGPAVYMQGALHSHEMQGMVAIDGVTWDYTASFQVIVHRYPTILDYPQKNNLLKNRKK